MNHGNRALTLDEVRSMAPSAFAMVPHGSRSERYQYVSTVELMNAMLGEGFHPFLAKQSRVRDLSKREFTKHLLRFRPLDYAGLKVQDVFPEVVLVNSHDGTSAYVLTLGLFRLVCSNGAVVSEGTFESVHIRHQGDVVRQVVEASHKALQAAPATLDTVARWQTIDLTPNEQGVFAAAAHTLRFGDSEGKTDTPIQPAQLLAPRRYDDKKPDLWHTFNRVQENVIRGGLSAVGRNAEGRRRMVRTREVKGIDQDMKLNRALWQLAERMAELKSASA